LIISSLLSAVLRLYPFSKSSVEKNPGPTQVSKIFDFLFIPIFLNNSSISPT